MGKQSGMSFDDVIASTINQRRRQVLVHSCIYYRFNTSIVTDKQFDAWAYELVALQATYPDIASKCVYANEFAGFDGTTGFNLPIDDPRVENKARQLLEI